MKLSIGYITFPTKKEAKDITVALLERSLIACVNLLEGVESYYAWNDEITKSKEVIAIIKTSEKNEGKIIKFVSKYHSYDVPCIVFIPIVSGHGEYLKWIDNV